MKHTYKHTKPQPSWLLQGLMIRAGLYDLLPPVASKRIKVKHEEKWWRQRWLEIRKAFGLT